MAKRKKPVSIFNLPKEEVEKASSKIIQDTKVSETKEPTHIEPIKEEKKEIKSPKQPKKKAPTKSKKKEEVKDELLLKRKFLYVDEVRHQKAKINAAIKGMKLQDYIAWLIDNDSQQM